MTAVWVRLCPLDTVTFRDGRPFDAGTDRLARSHTLPLPSTAAGAVGAALDSRPDEIVGPLLTEGSELQFPLPLDILRSNRTWTRAVPHKPAGVTDCDGAPGCGLTWLAHGVGDPARRTISVTWLQTYLHTATNQDGSLPERLHDTLTVRWTSPVTVQRRVGLVRRPDRTAEEGLLYASEHVRLGEGVSFACQALYDGGSAPNVTTTVVQLGGERRGAEVELQPDTDDSLRLPDPAPDVSDGRVLVYLATPGLFPDGWRLRVPAGATLVSACVEGPDPVATFAYDTSGHRSGWAMRWAIRPGSVYYLEFDDGDRAAAFRDKWHGRSLPRSETEHDLLRTAGFGMCLIGRW